MTCGSCGQELPAGARFCNACGAANAPSSERHAGPGRVSTGAVRVAASPREYTPPHLAEKILRSRSALEGERKQVTVLFADVRNSMELAAQLDAEDWHVILDRLFQLLAEGVHRFEGTINQYTGDGIMALFGAPVAHEDHAQRACYAALHLTESVAELAHELRREFGLDFQMRLGLNSGEVVVGKIGDDLRMDYTAHGETVGLAQRMESLAETGRPYLTRATAALAEGWFQLADLGEFKVKGALVPVQVFALDGVGSVHTRLDLSRARGFSRFVGRADDLATLEAALAQTLEGQGQVVGIVADAGVGKSRLCFEFVDRCRARGITVREAQAVSHGRNVPLLPVLQLLRDIFGIDVSDTDAEARQKIAGTVVLRDGGLQNDLQLLFEFMSVPDPKRPAPPLEPDERQRRLQALLSELLKARGREEAAVYLVEDLHWIDEASEDFVNRMVETIPGTQSLVVVNFRPEYEAPWGGKSYYRQLPLLPLGPDAMRELLEYLLGSSRSLGDLAARIQQRATGNPFFIEEMVQALVDAGNLQGERGDYQLVTPVREIALPERVETILAARIDRIDEREKLVLQTAAVIGAEFSRSILGKVCDLDADDLDEALRGLTAAEFVHERQIYPEIEYAFKHPLTQDVAYRSLLGERRRSSHEAVARAIEECAGERLDELAALLAHHYEEAGAALAAARWHRLAAERAGLMHVQDAYRHWGRVRELTDELPDDTEAVQLGTVARVQMFGAGARLDVPEEEMEQLFRESKVIADRSGNDAGRAQLLIGYGFYRLYVTGNAREASRALAEATDLADRLGILELRLAARFASCAVHIATDLNRTVETSGEALELLRSQPQVRDLQLAAGFRPETGFRFVQATALTQLGRLAEARESLAQLRGLAREDEAAVGLCRATECFLAFRTGDAAVAERESALLIEGGEVTGNASSLVIGFASLGESLVRQGRAAEAIAPLARALEIHREKRIFRQLEHVAALSLARARMQLGELDHAEEIAREALVFTRERGLLNPEGAVEQCIAQITLAREGVAGAPEIERALAHAEEIIEVGGGLAERPAIHELRAELAGITGDRTECNRQLQLARRLYEEMGATGHLERLRDA